MKNLEKYKIVPQAKFVKFKVKHFVEIPKIHHDKAVLLPAWLPKIIFPPPECVPTLALEVQQLPPALLMTQKSSPLIPGRTLCNFDRKVSINTFSVEELKVVETKIIKTNQRVYFENEIKILKGITNHIMLERIACLNWFIDSYEILRVGERLEKSTLDESVTHPIILPKSGKVADFLIRWCHQKTAHVGETSLALKLDPQGIGWCKEAWQ